MLKWNIDTVREISGYVNERVNILDVVNLAGVKVSKMGSLWRGNCPFPDHEEKTPSFTVSIEKNYVHCFGCNRTWFPLNFYKDIERLTWKEAVVDIAKAFSIDLSRFTREPTKDEKDEIAIKQLNMVVANWTNGQIKNHPEVSKYLTDRYGADSISRWKLGYCPDGTAMMNFLLKKQKYTYEVTQRADIKNFLFHDRIIYPIFNIHGEVVGFSNRVWAPTKEQEDIKYKTEKANGTFKKFFNTSCKSIVFRHKSEFLYGIHYARQAIKKEKGTVIIVEGPSDVIAMHKHGFENCLAVLSMAFNKFTIKTLSDISVQNVIFCLDGDSRGQKSTLDLLAAKRKTDFELPDNSLAIKYSAISIPAGLDPDEFLESPDGGSSAFKKKLDKAFSLPEFYVNHHCNIRQPKTITEKMDFLSNLRKSMRGLLSETEIRMLTKCVYDKFGIMAIDMSNFVNMTEEKQPVGNKIEEKILAWLVQNKDFRQTFVQTEDVGSLFSSQYFPVYDIICQMETKKFGTKDVLDALDNETLNIDIIINALKEKGLFNLFKTEKSVREMLLQPLGDTKGALQNFIEDANRRKFKKTLIEANKFCDQFNLKDTISYIKNQIEEMEKLL